VVARDISDARITGKPMAASSRSMLLKRMSTAIVLFRKFVSRQITSVKMLNMLRMDDRFKEEEALRAQGKARHAHHHQAV
jgi:hypothetical protein